MRGVSRNPLRTPGPAPPETHESLICRKTVGEVPLTGLSFHLASVFLVPYTPIMKTLSISYPESLLGSLHVSEGEFAREARMAMAVKLFDTGRLSSGQAADLADMPRVHFLYELGRWGVSALQTSEDELESDLNVARTLHDRHQH